MDPLKIVKQYSQLRLKFKNNELMELLDDKIIIDQIGTLYQGKKQVLQHIIDNKPEGEWQDPILGENGVIVKGKVYRFFMWWHLTVLFELTPEGKIHKITISRNSFL